MTFLNPTFLWGLLALAIPLAIHLWSRKKVRTIKVGSIQFISETQSRQSKSIQLNEWWLFILRCLAIAMLVIILAEPHLKTTTQQDAITYVFEPSLLLDEKMVTRFKEIHEGDWRILAPGFPSYDPDQELAIPEEVPNYWQLAKEMEQLSSDSIVVFTNAFAKGLKGKRPCISATVHWVYLDLAASVSRTIQLIKKRDSLEVLTVESDGEYLAFAKAKNPISQFEEHVNSNQDSLKIQINDEETWMPICTPTPIEVHIVYDDSLEHQVRFFKAGFSAIARYLGREIRVEISKNKDRLDVDYKNHLIWLSNAKTVFTNKKVLMYKPNPFAERLIEPGNAQAISYLTTEIDLGTVQSENLAEELLEWLNLHTVVEHRASRFDRRTMDNRQFIPKKSTETVTTKQVATADISFWFWLLLGILLIAERVLARFRKQ